MSSKDLTDEVLVDIEDNNEARITSFVAKAVTQNDVMATSNKLPDDWWFSKRELNNKILPPPYDPFKLSILVESSSILSQCIDAMEVNVDSFGTEFVPAVDNETFEELRDEQEAALGLRDQSNITDDRGRKRVKLTEIDQEELKLKNFFKYLNPRLSYVQLRKRLRRDIELTGNGYWEVLRNQVTKKITGIEWLASQSVRIGRVDRSFTNINLKMKISDTTIEKRPAKYRFRRYVQMIEHSSKPIWFKEYNDPRLMDAETGARAVWTGTDWVNDPENAQDGYEPFSVEKLNSGRMMLATEVLHFINFKSSRSMPYGIPRWIGNLISIMGSRSSEEVNLLYFDNKTVPPGMMMVEGGKLAKDTVQRLTDHIRDNIKGQKNYHSILVVEAAATENKNPNMPPPAIPRIKWVPMKDQQNGDALFQKYDQSNIDKVVSSFRFWAGFVGRTKEINLATARVARELSEEQVFQPEREEFDSIINRTLLVDMDINYWEHKSRGPQLTTPRETADILNIVKPFITGEEARVIVSKIIGKELDSLENEEWVKKPLELVIAELTKLGNELNTAIEESGADENDVSIPGEEEKEDQLPPGTSEEVKKLAKRIQKGMDKKPQTTLKFVKQLIAVRKALALNEVSLNTKYLRGE